jgi:hypothetical protein
MINKTQTTPAKGAVAFPMGRHPRRLLTLCLLICLGVVSLLLLAGAGTRQTQAEALVKVARPALSPQLPQPGNSPAYAPGRLLVKVRAGTRLYADESGKHVSGQASLDRVMSEQGVIAAEALFGGTLPKETDLSRIYRLQLAEYRDVTLAADALSRDPNVEYAEPDYIASQITPPNDPRYGEQWALNRIQAEGAWDVVTGTAGVVIAIIDSGIDLTHPDLAPNLWVNPGEIAGNSQDDDGNGFIDDIRGWNFVNANNDVSDENGHGTLVSGISAARTNNGIGIAGVCWTCRIMPVKVMQPSGFANYSDIALGVQYAAAKGARVINLSLGGYANSQALRDAISAAVDQGVTVVGGAGNDNSSTPFYPAAYDNVIAVAGTTITDTRASFSNYGAWVDVSAPGAGILSTAAGGDYVTTNGTSMAAPFASGMAALLTTLHPEWTPAFVRAQLVHTADDIDALIPGYEGLLGSGRINATAAVQPSSPIFTMSGYNVNGVPNGRPNFGQGAAIQVGVLNDWAVATGVTGNLTTTDTFVTIVNGTVPYGSISTGQVVTNTTPFSATIGAGAGYNHPIPFQLHLTATSGYSATLLFTVTTISSIQQVQGTISQNTTWTSDHTYLVVNNVGVAPNVTLSIEPGTTVRFNGNYSLNVGGTLVANGTAAQPIEFVHNSSGTWNRIYFDDPSVDAVADANGNYQSGCMLSYVDIQGAINGIASNNATPYLSHVTTDGGQVNGLAGSTPIWIIGSDLNGPVNMTSSVGLYNHFWGSTIQDIDQSYARLIIIGRGEVLTSTVPADVRLSLGGTVRATTAGSVLIQGGALVQQSTITSVIVDTGTVENNTVLSAITINSGNVLSNTVAGGITTGSGSTVRANNIDAGEQEYGIRATGPVTATHNRVTRSSAAAISVTAGLVEGNLVANTNNNSDGLRAGAATIISNTFTGVRGRTIYSNFGVPIRIAGNNFAHNTGPYDIYNDNPAGQDMEATNNWWGTTDTSIIEERIYDFYDDFSKGRVLYALIAAAPAPDAAGYVTSVTLTPSSPVGIQTAVFDVLFNRAMDTNVNPDIDFTKWKTYNTANSGLPDDDVYSFGFESNNVTWVGTRDNGVGRFDGTNWILYNTGNSPLPNDTIYAITVEGTGAKWFGTLGGVARFDGTNWAVYNTSNSPLPSNEVTAIAVDSAGNKWFSTFGGVAKLTGTNWTVYNTTNSGLPDNAVLATAVDSSGGVWFGTYYGGVARFDGTNWTVYNTSNSPLPSNAVDSIVIEPNGTMWFATLQGLVRLDGASWTVFNSQNSPIRTNSSISVDIDGQGTVWVSLSDNLNQLARFDGNRWYIYDSDNLGSLQGVTAVAIRDNGLIWLGSSGGGACVSSGGFPANDSQWVTPSHFQASYDFTSLVSRGPYTVTVANALGTDGVITGPERAYTFTVDYAGSIGVTDPPPPPQVIAWNPGNLTTIQGNWAAYDPHSPITLYQYSIGTAPGRPDVVNWTTTTITSVVRSTLNLTLGQTYYMSVKARNEGGLWSQAGSSDPIVAGFTPTATPTIAGTATRTVTATSTNTPLPTQTPGGPSATIAPSNTPIPASATRTNTTVPPSSTPRPPTQTPGGPTATPVLTNTPVATATACTLQYTDVPGNSTFYSYVRCLACRGIISGYPCGGEIEPCDGENNPYFRPNVNVTRGQIAKIVSNSAGYDDDPGAQIYEDVPSSNTFYQWINRLSSRGHMGGYQCGGEGEPCGVEEMPYFRPFANATRGQLAKIVSNAAGLVDLGAEQIFADVPPDNSFYVWIQRLASRGIMGGYACGGEGEPCDDQERPYFRPYNTVTRGQTSKIVAGAFFPNCQTP